MVIGVDGLMLFYDYEVFHEDWLVVIMDIKNQKETIIHNDREKLIDFHEKNNHEIWVGYNNKGYDQWIHKALICGLDPKELNDWIIVENKKPWEFSKAFWKVYMYNYDVMNFGDGGLKTLEAYMGNNIHESDVPFDIERKLTEEEIQATIEYCRYDVQQTAEVFLKRQDQFNAHMGLIKIASGDHGLNLNLLGSTDANLSATLLDARKVTRDDEFDITFPDTLKLDKYKYVQDWYKNPENHDYEKRLETKIAGVPHVFGWGGIHGAIDQYHGKGDYLLMDVGSMYPSLMIEYDLLSRNVRDPKYFEEIYKQRMKYKAEGNPIQESLKLVLNTTYGAMGASFNKLHDQRMRNLVCIYGQLLLLDLVEKLEGHVQVIQTNTDGVLIKINNDDDYYLVDDIAYEWEKRTRLSLEFEEFTQIHQKDVNNYVMVEKNGTIHSKGSYVKKLNDLDNNLPIVNKALIDAMTKNIPVEQTINECDELLQFQMVAKVTGKFSHFLHGRKRLPEKTVRVFASTDKRHKGLVRVHKETGNEFKQPSSPEHCFLNNDDLHGVKVPSNLDKQFYIEMAQNRLKDFGVVL